MFTSNAVWDCGLSSRLVTVAWPSRETLCEVLEMLMQMCWCTLDLTGAIRIGHQVKSSCLTSTRLCALMLRDSSGEMCFVLFSSPTEETKVPGLGALLLVNLSFKSLFWGVW